MLFLVCPNLTDIYFKNVNSCNFTLLENPPHTLLGLCSEDTYQQNSLKAKERTDRTFDPVLTHQCSVFLAEVFK